MEAEKIAENFHYTYEFFAPSVGYTTRPESAVAWRDVPDRNKQLMITVVQDLLDRGVIQVGENL